MQLTRPKAIAIMLLAVLAALGSASLVFAPPNGALLELNPVLGCPGQQVTVVATLPFPVHNGAAGSVAGSPVIVTSDPDGLISKATFEVGENTGIEVRGTFIVADFVCAGQYTVTITLANFVASDGQTHESVSTHFTVGGQGCPNLRDCRPVGGVLMPTNRLAITAPYLALAGLVVAVSAVVAVKRRRD